MFPFQNFQGWVKKSFFPLLCSERRRKTDLKYAFRIVIGHLFFPFFYRRCFSFCNGEYFARLSQVDSIVRLGSHVSAILFDLGRSASATMARVFVRMRARRKDWSMHFLRAFQSATFCRIPGLSNSGVSLLTALALGAAIDICRWARTSSKNFDHFKTIPLHNRIDASAFENAKRGEAARDILIRQGTADYCTGRTSQKRKEVSCVLLRAWRLV